MKFAAGKIVPYPHGTMIVDGIQTWMLSSRKTEKYSGLPVLLIENSHAVGLIRLNPVGFFDTKDIQTEHLFKKHQHTRKEIKEWWGDTDQLWVDSIEVISKFMRPLPVVYPAEAVVWVTPEQIKFLDLFESIDLVHEWRERWKSGKWDKGFIWSILEIDSPDHLRLNTDKVEDSLLYILITQGSPDLTDLQKGERSNAIKTIFDFDGWKDIKTDSLLVAFEVLSLMDDEEYRNITLNAISKELANRGVDKKPQYELVVFSYLPISEHGHSGPVDKSILKLFENGAILFKDAVCVVGSVVEGSGNDLDILIKQEVPLDLAKRIAFRIGRACSLFPDKKFHIIRDSGPITSFIPIYDIALVPTKQTVVKMQRDNRITPPMKPIRPDDEGTPESAIKLIKAFGLKGFIQPKFDGIHCFASVNGKDRFAISDDGEDITDAVKEILDLLPDGDYVLDGEIETWVDGKHQPREVTAGNVKSKRTSNLTYTVFDCLYYNGQDIRLKPFSERLRRLKEICYNFKEPTQISSDKIYISPSYEVNDEQSLIAAIEPIVNNLNYEGFVWKSYDGPYIPNRNRGYQIKWHRSTKITGVTLNRIETKVPGVFNYEWGILAGDLPVKRFKMLNGEKYMLIGKTFSSKNIYNIGEKISIEAETVNLILDDDQIDLTVWAPRVIEEA